MRPPAPAAGSRRSPSARRPVRFGHIYRRTEFRAALLRRARGPAVYPAFHVIAGLAALAGAPVLATEVSPGGMVEALAVRDGARTVLWLANLTAEAVTVELPAEVAEGWQIASLEASCFAELTRRADYLDAFARPAPDGPVRLDAYSVVRLEAR